MILDTGLDEGMQSEDEGAAGGEADRDESKENEEEIVVCKGNEVIFVGDPVTLVGEAEVDFDCKNLGDGERSDEVLSAVTKSNNVNSEERGSSRGFKEEEDVGQDDFERTLTGASSKVI